MRIVFFGDIVGRVGRKTLASRIGEIVQPGDVVIANGENAAGGVGIDPETAKEIWSCGVQVMTSGNHIWHRKEVFGLLEERKQHLLRPINYPAGTAGCGWSIIESNGVRVGIVNAIGRVFTGELVECPFRALDRVLESELRDCVVRFVDFHAEATSEKVALGHYLDGRVTAVVGTHTHVQTADEMILPKGTAYISDVGMCGPIDSVIGVRIDDVVNRFVSGLPHRFDVAKGRGQINAVIVTCDQNTGRASSIERLRIDDPAI